MTFEDFFKIYSEDMELRLKRNTWLTKEHIVRTKILPYFKKLKMNEIIAANVIKWQNELIAYKDENGVGYSMTYRKTMHNQLSCIFNHVCKFYNLRNNPARQAGCMGREEAKEMLYWTGMRLGECLALTMADFDFNKNTVRICKSYQRLEGEDVITTPKTKKSNRTIKLPKFLAEEMKVYFEMLYGYKETDRIFQVTKSYLHHEMERGSKMAGVKRIRIHDLRHSHVLHLIELGFSALAIADRVGHESIDITYRYAHLFPSTQIEMADKLDVENDRRNGADDIDDEDATDDCKIVNIDDYLVG